MLTDIKMPGMDGIELLRKIKETSPNTEVIMITGHGDMDLAIKSLKYEAVDFVTKPINDDVLDIALKRAHEKISMRERLKEYTENLENLVIEKSARLIELERQAAVGRLDSRFGYSINIARLDIYLSQGYQSFDSDSANLFAVGYIFFHLLPVNLF